MANLDAARGLEPVDNGPAGTAPRIQTYTAGTHVRQGQILVRTASASTVATITGVVLTTTKNIIGVAAHSAASGDRVAVYNSVKQRFVVQVDDNTVTTVAGFLDRNFNVTHVDEVNSTLDYSILELDGNTATSVDNTTTAAPLRVVDILSAPNNSVSNTWTKVVVQFNPTHHLDGLSSGV